MLSYCLYHRSLKSYSAFHALVPALNPCSFTWRKLSARYLSFSFKSCLDCWKCYYWYRSSVFASAPASTSGSAARSELVMLLDLGSLDLDLNHIAIASLSSNMIILEHLSLQIERCGNLMFHLVSGISYYRFQYPKQPQSFLIGLVLASNLLLVEISIESRWQHTFPSSSMHFNTILLVSEFPGSRCQAWPLHR